VINVYDFPHGARGLRVAWLCEEMGLASRALTALEQISNQNGSV
jgi:hypothetical protein